MKLTERKERRLLNELISQSSEQGSRKSNINLPRINKSVSNSHANDRGSTNSVDSHLNEKKHFKNDRWKANQLYIDDYMPNSNRRVHTQNKKIDRNAEMSKKKAFFTGLNSDSQDGDQCLIKINKQEIKQYVQNTEELINTIKKNRAKLIKLKINGPKKIKQQGYFKEKNQHKDEIYNYFFRDFVYKKDKELSEDVLDRYVVHSSPENLRSIECKGRQFLLNKVQNDYKNYAKVEDYKKSYIRSLILKQIQAKKTNFQQQYKTRNSSPYLSFLTLSKDQKSRVIQRKQRRSFV